MLTAPGNHVLAISRCCTLVNKCLYIICSFGSRPLSEEESGFETNNIVDWCLARIITFAWQLPFFLKICYFIIVCLFVCLFVCFSCVFNTTWSFSSVYPYIFHWNILYLFQESQGPIQELEKKMDEKAKVIQWYLTCARVTDYLHLLFLLTVCCSSHELLKICHIWDACKGHMCASVHSLEFCRFWWNSWHVLGQESSD